MTTFKDFLLLEDTEQWIAAKEAGLDLSQEARRERAEAMGYDTSKVWYHGSINDIKAFKKGSDGLAGPAAYFALQSSDANRYADVYRNRSGQNVSPVFLKRGDYISLDFFTNKVVKDFGSNARAQLEKDGIDGILFDFGVQKDFKMHYHDSYPEGPVLSFDDIPLDSNTFVAVFDMSHIRSVNAVFDPDAAKSSDILA